MDGDPAAHLLFDEDDEAEGAGSDVDFRCAIDGLYDVSSNSRLDENAVSVERCCIDQSNSLVFGVEYGDDHMFAPKNRKIIMASFGENYNIGQSNTENLGFSYEGTCSMEAGVKKRLSNEACPVPKSKARREKIRRDILNDKFLELSSVLDPGRAPKCDKVTILSDTVRMLMQLKTKAEELKASNEKLQETIKELKAEKNDLRDEKTRLKSEKERLEQQLKSSMAVPPPGLMLPPMAFHPGIAAASFSAPPQVPPESKSSTSPAAGFPAYPGVPMWQWLPSTVRDTTQDANLWSPNA